MRRIQTVKKCVAENLSSKSEWKRPSVVERRSNGEQSFLIIKRIIVAPTQQISYLYFSCKGIW